MPASEWSSRLLIELARSGERVRFRALGRSMGRAIPNRSLVEIAPCPGSELAIGQIAAFERGGRVVVHRVAAVKPGGVQFASDARGHGDGWVAHENVLGRAHVVERPRQRLQEASFALLLRAGRALAARCGPRECAAKARAGIARLRASAAHRGPT